MSALILGSGGEGFFGFACTLLLTTVSGMIALFAANFSRPAGAGLGIASLSLFLFTAVSGTLLMIHGPLKADGTFSMTAVPVLLILGSGIPGAAAVALGWRSLRRKRRNVSGTCSRCGYSLRGLLEARCPECGLRFPPHMPVPPPHQRNSAGDD